MQPTFRTKTLRKLCEDERAAVAKFGFGTATELHAVLADLLAASTFGEVPLAPAAGRGGIVCFQVIDTILVCQLIPRGNKPFNQSSRFLVEEIRTT
ncbi:MAG: hypothetical protein R3B89_24760 [Polyangiaceae bacterium]